MKKLDQIEKDVHGLILLADNDTRQDWVFMYKDKEFSIAVKMAESFGTRNAAGVIGVFESGSYLETEELPGEVLTIVYSEILAENVRSSSAV